MHNEMMALVHAFHIGMKTCIRRAHGSMFWPQITTELKEYILKFGICKAHHTIPVMLLFYNIPQSVSEMRYF